MAPNALPSDTLQQSRQKYLDQIERNACMHLVLFRTSDSDRVNLVAGITGPNGAGKSTLLNAVLFGLGESAPQLGARQVSAAELRTPPLPMQ